MNNWETEITCFWCSKKAHKYTGHVNRAKRQGKNVFCTKQCFYDSRKTTKAEKIEVKRVYDIKYRAENEEMLKEKDRIYCESPAGRAMQKRQREKNKEKHKEYIKSDRYRAWKQKYDQKYCAKKNYGEFWESSIILRRIEGEIDTYQANIDNQTYNKSQKRKTNEKFKREKLKE